MEQMRLGDGSTIRVQVIQNFFDIPLIRAYIVSPTGKKESLYEIRGIWRKDVEDVLSLSDITPALLYPRGVIAPPEGYKPPEVSEGHLYAIETNGDVSVINGGAWKYARWMDYTYSNPLTIDSTPKTYIIRGAKTPVKGWPWRSSTGAVRYVDVTATLTSAYNEVTGASSRSAVIRVDFLNALGVAFDEDSPLYLPPWIFEVQSGEVFISDGWTSSEGLVATHTLAAHNNYSWLDIGVLSIKPDGSAAVLGLCEDQTEQILDFVIIDLAEQTYSAEMFDINVQGSVTYSKEYVNGTVWLREITGRTTLSSPPREKIDYEVLSREGRLGANESATSTITTPIWFGFNADGNIYRVEATYVKSYSGTVGGHSIEDPTVLSGSVISYPVYKSGTYYNIDDVVYRSGVLNSGQYVARRSGTLPAPPFSGSNSNWLFTVLPSTVTGYWTQYQTSGYSYDFSVTLKRISVAPEELSGYIETTIYTHSENRSGERQSTIKHYSLLYPLTNNGINYDHPSLAHSYQNTISESVSGDVEHESSETRSYALNPTQYQTHNSWDPSDPYGANFSRYVLRMSNDTILTAYSSPRRLFLAMPWGYRMFHDSSGNNVMGLILPASGTHALDSTDEWFYFANAIDAPDGFGIKTLIEGTDGWDYFSGEELDNRLSLFGYIKKTELTDPAA